MMTNSFMSIGHLLPPEAAHRAAIHALQLGLFRSKNRNGSCLAQNLMGLDFSNPLGVAAGFDKDAEVPIEVLRSGFGFTEVGTITPLPQPGNAKPRIFRLKEYEALINRFGFNSQGHAAAYDRLLKIKSRPGPIGLNIGANKNTEDFVNDYVKGIHQFTDIADYFTINISSPNTPGLRDLQYGESLNSLVLRLSEARAEAFETHKKRPPVLLKIAPDLDDNMLDAIVKAYEISGFEGLIISNTTLSRASVDTHPYAEEMGGLSGRPLAHASTVMLAKTRQRVGADPILVGVGGIYDVTTALDKIKAGANLIQLYSALTYQGFGLADKINSGIEAHLSALGQKRVDDIRGTEVDDWASK